MVLTKKKVTKLPIRKIYNVLMHPPADADTVADRENREELTVRYVYEKDTLSESTKASKICETRSLWSRMKKADTLPMLSAQVSAGIEENASFLEDLNHGGGWSTEVILQLPICGLPYQPGDYS